MKMTFGMDVSGIVIWFFKSTKIWAWHVEGLTADELTDDILGKKLLVFQIVLLTDMWALSMDNFCIPGQTYFNYPR